MTPEPESKTYKDLKEILAQFTERERALVERDPRVLEARRILAAAEALVAVDGGGSHVQSGCAPASSAPPELP